MQKQCERGSLSSLHLLVPQLRLLAAAVWQMAQQRDIMNYGMLEEFVTSVTETVPELLSYRQRAQLILGLRARLVLELCRTESLAALQPHLDRIRTPAALPGGSGVSASESLAALQPHLDRIRTPAALPGGSGVSASESLAALQPHLDRIRTPAALPGGSGVSASESLAALQPHLDRIRTPAALPGGSGVSASESLAALQPHLDRIRAPAALPGGSGVSASESLAALQPHLDRIRAPAALPGGSGSVDASEVEASETDFLELVQMLLQDPVERDVFFQDVFPVEYGPKYDTALQKLMWVFLSRLEEALPVPSIKQIASMLSAAPTAMEECVQCLSQPQQLKTLLQRHKDLTHLETKTLLQHHKDLTHLETSETSSPLSSPLDDCIVSCLSLPPGVRVVVASKQTDSDIQLESDHDGPSSFFEEVTVESGMLTAYAAVEQDRNASRCEEKGRGVESTMKEQEREYDQSSLNYVEEGEHEVELVCEEMEDLGEEMEVVDPVERPVEMRDDLDGEIVVVEVMSPVDEVVEELGEEMEPVDEVVESNDGGMTDDQQDQSERSEVRLRDGEDDQQDQSERAEVRLRDGEDDQQDQSERAEVRLRDGEDDQQDQSERSEVRLRDGEDDQLLEESKQQCRSDETGHISPHSALSHGEKSDDSQQLEKDLLNVVTSCMLRQPAVKLDRLDVTGIALPLPLPPGPIGPLEKRKKREVKFQRRKTVVRRRAQEIIWVIPEEEHNAVTTDSVVIQKTENKDGAVASSVVFGCSQCSFSNVEEVNLHHHIRKDHPEEYRRLLGAGIRRAENLSSKRAPVSKTCPICRKTFTRGTDMRRHQRSHSEERAYQCSRCGKSYKLAGDLRRHQINVCVEADLHKHPEDPEEHSQAAAATQSGYEIARALSDVPQHPLPSKETSSSEQPSESAPGSKTCLICWKTLSRGTDMRRHQISHSGERPYQCTLCGKSYKFPFDLRRHELYQCVEANLHKHPDILEEPRQAVAATQSGNAIAQGSSDIPQQSLPCNEATSIGRPSEGHSLAPSKKTTAVKKPFACDVCRRKFPLSSMLERHRRTHGEKHPKHQYKCRKCDCTFRALKDVRRHQRNHWGDDPLRCSQCGRLFQNSSQLVTHKQIHSAIQCTLCNETLPGQECLRKHYLEAHDMKGAYPCSHCEKSFPELCALVGHLRAHTGERPYPCSQCPKRFKLLSTLNKHEVIHTGVKPFLCEECGKIFATSTELFRHRRCHSDERPYSCSQCGKLFKRERYLQQHMESHSGQRASYPCTYCGKTFIQPYALKRHNLIHTGERPYSCPRCSKTFLTNAEVLKHMRYHTGERPFNCTICGKSFTQSCSLTRHERVHTKERPYACTVCDKSFDCHTHLKRHKLIHTGEKPFKCECGKAFNRKNLLTIHQKTHSTNEGVLSF